MKDNSGMPSFPIYRKYLDGRTFFKILSPDEFEEIQILKKKCRIHRFKAEILPDRNYIQDMLYNFEEHWEESDEQEYNEVKRSCFQ